MLPKKANILLILTFLVLSVASGHSIRDILSIEDKTLFQEFQTAYNLDVTLPQRIQENLESDIFEKLDLNKDGVVDCDEAGKLFRQRLNELGAELADENGSISKDFLTPLLSYPAPKLNDDSPENCEYEHFLVNSKPEDLWTDILGSLEVVDMDELAQNLFIAINNMCKSERKTFSRTDFGKPAVEMTENSRRARSSHDKRELVSLAGYKAFRNQACADFVPNNRRNLYEGERFFNKPNPVYATIGAMKITTPWFLAAEHNHNTCTYMGRTGRWYAQEGLSMTYTGSKLLSWAGIMKRQTLDDWYHDSSDDIWKRCVDKRRLLQERKA